MRPGYLDTLTQELSPLLVQLHLVQGAPTPTAVAVAATVGAVALAVGLILGSRLVAPSSAGAVIGLALAIPALAVGVDAIRFQLEPLGPVAHAVFTLLTVALTVELARRVLDVGLPRTLLTLAVGGFFGALIAALLMRAVQLGNAF